MGRQRAGRKKNTDKRRLGWPSAQELKAFLANHTQLEACLRFQVTTRSIRIIVGDDRRKKKVIDSKTRAQIVSEVQSGELSRKQAALKYGIGYTTVNYMIREHKPSACPQKTPAVQQRRRYQDRSVPYSLPLQVTDAAYLFLVTHQYDGRPPCRDCPVHRGGYFKENNVCRECDFRVAHAVATADPYCKARHG